MKYGYIRISTKEQDTTRQLTALKREGILEENIFIDKISGREFSKRKGWQLLLSKLIIGDIIVIKELDRLGRNMKEVSEQWELISKKGVDIEILEQPMLNTTNKSKIEKELINPIIFHILTYIGEKTRENILRLQKEGYENLKIDAKGRKISTKKNKVIGRPNLQENLTVEQKRFIKAWIEKSIKLVDCIKATNLSKTTLYRIKKGL